MRRKYLLIGLSLLVLGLLFSYLLSQPSDSQYTTTEVDYNDIDYLRNVNGSLAYIATNEGSVQKAVSPFTDDEWFVVIDGERVNMDKKAVERIFDVDQGVETSPEKPYTIQENGETQIISREGNFTPEYEPVIHVFNENGSMFYSTIENNRSFFVVNETPSQKFNHIYQPTVVGGKLAYAVVDTGEYNGGFDNDSKFNEGDNYIVYEGKKAGGEFDSIKRIADIGGKLGYVAVENQTEFVVVNGTKVGEGYDRITYLEEIRGKPYYTGSNTTHFFLNYGNRSIGPFDTAVLNPAVVDNAIIFNKNGEIVKWEVIKS